MPQGQEPPPGYVEYPNDLEPVLFRDQRAATEASQARLDLQN